MATENDPATALANAHHEFGEHGGVNMSIEASNTFTVTEPKTMCLMFAGELGPDRDFFIYSHHFNHTVLNIGRLMEALKGTVLCSGGHVVASRTLYDGTHALLTHFSFLSPSL
ncbi:hypothetical protein V6N13_080350 [Hibiscus sabdariffa]